MKRHASDLPPTRRQPTAPSRAVALRQARMRVLRALAPVLIFLVTSIITQWSWFHSSKRERPVLRQERLGLVNFVDDTDSCLWGIFSIHKQMEKFNMLPTVEHIAVVTSEISSEAKELLIEWLGPGQVREINPKFVRDRVHDSLRKDEFVKTEAFNMPYDKLIVMNSDTLIRKSLMHWFDYPAPAATQAKGTVEWTTGAMVIEPDKYLYMTILEYLPLSRRWLPKQDYGKDTWNSGDSYQGFLSSFLLSKATDDTMFTMDYGSFVQSRDMQERKENQYFWKYRPESIETFNFGQAKPWRNTTSFPKNPSICAMLTEWAESVSDAPENRLPKLPKFLSKCKTTAQDEAWAMKHG